MVPGCAQVKKFLGAAAFSNAGQALDIQVGPETLNQKTLNLNGCAQVMDFLGAAAFSKAVQALDIQAGRLVCLKIIKNNKDYFDQSLDEIKLLNYVNAADPLDEHGMLRLYDYFYYKARSAASCRTRNSACCAQRAAGVRGCGGHNWGMAGYIHGVLIPCKSPHCRGSLACVY